MYFVVCVGFCWARVGSILGLISGHFGLCWDILGHVGTILLSHGYFGICVGLCLGFGRFNVVEFSSMQGVCKKHRKYQGKKHNFWAALLIVLFFGCFCFFLL